MKQRLKPVCDADLNAEGSVLRRKGVKRIIIMVCTGIVIAFVVDVISGGQNPERNHIHDYVISVLLTFAIWEGNIRMDRWMNRILPWQSVPGKRFLVHGLTNILFTALLIYGSLVTYDSLVCTLPETIRSVMLFSSIVLGSMLSTIILSIEVGSQFYHKWKESIKEAERFKSESLQAQLINLKNQINPHFLFNNLNVLSALVHKDPDKATRFISELARVYRYTLDSRNSDLVSLQDELRSADAYNYLIQIRFGVGISVVKEIDASCLNAMLPPMALQVLIENTIQHNEVSRERPLKILIKTEGDSLSVSNNLQLRTHPEFSNGIGLENLKKRYAHFTERSIQIEQTPAHFYVKIPLLRLAS